MHVPTEAEGEYDDADDDFLEIDRSCSQSLPLANGAGASATSDKVGI